MGLTRLHRSQGLYPVEVCFSPLSWPLFQPDDALVVVVDIFRATTAICTAFQTGVKAIIPVAEIAESEAYKALGGYVIAGERDGRKLECAELGNSPFGFQDPGLKGKTIVLNTTNGTQALKMVSQGKNEVVIGAFSNLNTVISYALKTKKPVSIFCAGWKDRFSMEDSLFAGALVSSLLDADLSFYCLCDSALASALLWLQARDNPLEFIENAAHRHRLKNLGLDDIIPYSLQANTCQVLPTLHKGVLVNTV